MDANKVDKRLTAVTNALSSKIVDLELQILVLVELLSEKEDVTVEKLQEKYKLIQDREFKALSSEIKDLLVEYERKYK